jgi:hypothetical protein
MDCTHSVFDEYDIPEDVGEKAILQKIEYLYAVLEIFLNTGQVISLAHPYGENNDSHTVYCELKKHTLAFIRGHSSHYTLSQYIEAMQSPGKWCGTLFNVILHWYKQIKKYMWLQLIGVLPTQTLCLLQSAVDDIILLEYMELIDHEEHTYRGVSLTSIDVLQERHPPCSPLRKVAPDY